MGTGDTLRIKQNAIAATYTGNGRNTDGSIQTGPIFDPLSDGTMLGFAAMPIWSSRRQLFNPSARPAGFSWIQNGKGYCRMSLNPLNRAGWNHADWMNTQLHYLETRMKGVTPNWPDKLPSGSDFTFTQEHKTLFDKIKNAETPKEAKKLITQNKKVYQQLMRHLPQDVAVKLQNIPSYNSIYGKTYQNYKKAWKVLVRTKGKHLPKGVTFDQLGQEYAQARVNEAKFVNGQKVGEVKVTGKGNSTKVKTQKTGRWDKGTSKVSQWKFSTLSGNGKIAKGLRFAGRWGGKFFGAAAVVFALCTVATDTYNAATNAKEGEGWKDGSRQFLKSGTRAALEAGGAWAGMKIGAALGSFIPIPIVGTLVGGAIGAAVGYIAGKAIANNIDFVNKSVEEEHRDEAMAKQNKEICQAIDKGDIETVYEHTAQFKEQIVDENGQPVADENGNPAWRYIQVSEDEKEQKAFEKKVASLDNYVETEATKRQRKAELEAQAEAARQQQMAQMNFAGGYGNTYTGATNYTAQSSNGFAPIGYNFTPTNFNFTTTNTNSYAPIGSGYTPSNQTSTASWQNPVWQQSLNKQYNNSNFYTFNPNNYTPFGMLTQQSYAPAA